MNLIGMLQPKPFSHHFMLACLLAGWLCGPAISGHAQTNAAPSPDLQDVVKLNQQHLGDDIVIKFIQTSGKSYPLTSDDLIYLATEGISQAVIDALEQTAKTPPPPAAPPSTNSLPEPPAAPAEPAPVSQPVPAASQAAVAAGEPTPAAPAGPEISFQYFHDQLAPWGTWIELPGLGQVWKPADVVINASPDWRPYYDNGQWVQTENGLFWQSDYSWGDIPFHYGRWLHHGVYGWVWVPDYTWGPAWVFWRHAEDDGAVGWAALPPGAVFVDGAFVFNGAPVAVDFDFGLGEDSFVFVDGVHFHERFFRLRGREWHYHVGRERLHGFYGHSVIRNEFHRDEHGRLVNNGIGRERMEHMNNQVEQARFEERHPVGDRAKAGPTSSGERGGIGGAATAAHGPTANPAGGGAGGVSKVFRPPAAAAHASGGVSKPASTPAPKKK